MSPDDLAIARRVAARYDIDGLDADDLEQEASVAIIEARAKGVHDPGKLFDAARQRLYTLARGANRRAAREVNEATLGVELGEDVDAADPDDNPTRDAAELDALLSRCGDLTPRQREVIVGTHHDGFDDRTLAERMGMTTGAVRVLRHRALQVLRSSKSEPR